MKLVIDRKLWIRGYDPNTSSALMVRDGRMCCLGFHALACGIPVEEIRPQHRTHRLVYYPYALVTESIRQNLPESMAWLTQTEPVDDGTVTINSDDAQQLARVNDRNNITDEEREAEIAAIFAKHDVEVEFIN